MNSKTNHRVVNGLLGFLCLAITIHQCVFAYERFMSKEGFSAVISFIFGALSIIGWVFITFSCFNIDVYDTLKSMLLARVRLHRKNKK